jgi:diguanylate cyclase (GGDEF)-like protein
MPSFGVQEGLLRTPSPISLSPDPPRYPLLIAALWIAGCGAFAASVAWVPLSEPFYLPAVLAVAWYYGLSWGLGAAVASAVAALVAEAIVGAVFGPGALVWNFLARSMLFGLPAWLLFLAREQRREIAGLMRIDPATGFFTRHGLLGTLADELVRTERFGGETSVVAIGLNGLFKLASRHGAERAEEVVESFCTALSTSSRRTDGIGRLAEEEFAIMLRGTGAKAAEEVAAKLSGLLTEWLLTQGHDLTCSVGWTTAPRGRSLDAGALIDRAVGQMYQNRGADPLPRAGGKDGKNGKKKVVALPARNSA